jgi:hypothetical protein
MNWTSRYRTLWEFLAQRKKRNEGEEWKVKGERVRGWEGERDDRLKDWGEEKKRRRGGKIHNVSGQ